jgi:hypothetical protein|tara:strand:+ start:394 stop:1332 length:939 start_codon:yes stop_codon:yes gene_type:complete
LGILIEIIMPVFGLVILGYLAARMGWFEESGIKGLSSFVFNFAIPVMLFRTLATTALPQEMPWRFLGSYYLSGIALFVAAMLLGRTVFHQQVKSAGIFAMAGAYSNVVLLGIPLILTTFGNAASLPLFMIVATQAAVMFFATTVVVESAGGHVSRLRHLPWQTIVVLARNPIIVGLLLGLVFNLLELAIPSPIDAVAKSLGGAALPCAVFSVGASLSQYRVKGSLPEALSLVALKNVVHPVLVWIMADRIFHLDAVWTATAVLLAGTPVGVNVYLFAQRYGALIAPAAAAVVLSTGTSIVTLSVILYLLDVR